MSKFNKKRAELKEQGWNEYIWMPNRSIMVKNEGSVLLFCTIYGNGTVREGMHPHKN